MIVLNNETVFEHYSYLCLQSNCLLFVNLGQAHRNGACARQQPEF